MSERKNVTINFYRVESSDETTIADLGFKLEAMVDSELNYGVFDGKSCELNFKVHSMIEVGERKLFIVSLVKERVFLPVQFNRTNGEIKEPELNPDSMGDISYYLIDTDYMAVLSLGGSGGMISDFLRWLSGDASCGVSPMYRGDTVGTIMSWEIFKKITFSLKAESKSMWADAMNRIMEYHGLEGIHKSIYLKPYLDCGGIVDSMGGSGLEITVTEKKCLNKEFVRGFIVHMGGDGLFSKLKVSGKCSDDQKVETIDLYNARLKHEAEIVIAGSHISPDEARSSLYEAYQLHLDDIEANVQEDGE